MITVMMMLKKLKTKKYKMNVFWSEQAMQFIMS
jgi:hypothetical protein